MELTRTADLWWKTAIVYCLDVETFFDGNGDGHGDFRGLAQKIDYLDRLGVTCLWLMPFYPSPTVTTVTTSPTYPWFQSARQGPDSPYYDWYVWQDKPPPGAEKGIVFPDKEESLWTYDRKAKQYFLHRFYKHQPDLNVANPAVRDEIARVMGFWLELGLSGFRVDGVPFLLDTEGSDDAANLPDPHDYLADLRAFLGRRRGDAVLLGEVNLPYPDTMKFFGDGDGVADELGEVSLTPVEVEAALIANARPLLACPGGCGAGLVDAGATIAAITAP